MPTARVAPCSAQQPRVEPFAAGQIDRRLAGQVADELHQREALDVGAPGLLLGSLILLGDRIVVGGHLAAPRKKCPGGVQVSLMNGGTAAKRKNAGSWINPAGYPRLRCGAIAAIPLLRLERVIGSMPILTAAREFSPCSPRPPFGPLPSPRAASTMHPTRITTESWRLRSWPRHCCGWTALATGRSAATARSPRSSPTSTSRSAARWSATLSPESDDWFRRRQLADAAASSAGATSSPTSARACPGSGGCCPRVWSGDRIWPASRNRDCRWPRRTARRSARSGTPRWAAACR